MKPTITSVRIDALLSEADLSQADLARRAGCTPGAVNQIMKGTTARSRYLPAIAKALHVPLHFLTGETDDPSDWETPVGSDQKQRDSVEVQEIDLAYGMGSTYLEDVPVKSNTVRFTRDWLRNFTDAKPDDLFFARGIGDSMMPTILDSDIILIDRSQASMRMNDQIWALSFGGMGMIKRLRSMPDGSLQILSDNPSVPETSAVDDEAHLIGRVVAVVRKI